MSQENVEIVKRMWDATERGDTKAVFALYDQAIVWDSHHAGPIERGLYYGHKGVRQFFRDWLESFETLDLHAEKFIEVGDRVVVGYRVGGRGRGSGLEVDMCRWNLYGIRNGLVTRVEIFGTEVEALEAAGMSE
jgi:ketosteroid isomerase-like protein